MAVSMMYALLGVGDEAELNAAADGTLPARYRDSSSSQKRKVKQAVYEGFYAILEGQKLGLYAGITGDATRAMGEALARIVTDDLENRTEQQREYARALMLILQEILNQAIDDNIP